MSKKKSKAYVGIIPFDEEGNQLHYPDIRVFNCTEWENATKIGKVFKSWQTPNEIESIDLSSYTDNQIETYHPDSWNQKQGIKVLVYAWNGKPNFIFKDTLVYSSYGRGRSAAYLIFTRESNNKSVIVFMTDSGIS